MTPDIIVLALLWATFLTVAWADAIAANPLVRAFRRRRRLVHRLAYRTSASFALWVESRVLIRSALHVVMFASSTMGRADP